MPSPALLEPTAAPDPSDLVGPPASGSTSSRFLMTAGAGFVTAGVGFVASVLVARELGVVDRGRLSFVLNALGILVMFGGAGSYAAITSVARHHRVAPRELYAGAAVVATVAAVVTGTAFVGAYWALADSLFSGVRTVDVGWVLLALAPTLVLNYWSGIAAVEDRVVRFALGLLAGAVAYLGAVLVLASLGSLRFATVVPAWVLASFVPALFLADRVRGLRRAQAGAVARRLAGFALRANPGDLAMLLVLRVDVLLVKGYRGFAELGVYAVGVAVAEVVLQAGGALRAALLRRQGSAASREGLPAHLARTMRLTVLVGALTYLPLVLVAGPAIRLLFGEAYGAAATTVAILVPGTIWMSMQGPLRDYLFVEGRSRVPTTAAAAALVVNVLLNVVLLPRHGFQAAAVASSIAYGVNLAGCAWAFGRATGLGPRDLLLVRRSDLARG